MRAARQARRSHVPRAANRRLANSPRLGLSVGIVRRRLGFQPAWDEFGCPPSISRSFPLRSPGLTGHRVQVGALMRWSSRPHPDVAIHESRAATRAYASALRLNGDYATLTKPVATPCVGAVGLGTDPRARTEKESKPILSRRDSSAAIDITREQHEPGSSA